MVLRLGFFVADGEELARGGICGRIVFGAVLDGIIQERLFPGHAGRTGGIVGEGDRVFRLQQEGPNFSALRRLGASLSKAALSIQT